MPSLPAGGQHVVGPGAVVAEDLGTGRSGGTSGRRACSSGLLRPSGGRVPPAFDPWGGPGELLVSTWRQDSGSNADALLKANTPA